MARRSSVDYWLTEDGILRISGWARDGLTNEQIAENMGCHRATLYKWAKEYNDIDNALKHNKDAVDREVENALYKNAIGYEYEEEKVYIEEVDGVTKRRKEVTKKQMPPNTTAQIFWLKNRKRNEWRDKQDIEHSGEVDTSAKSDIFNKYLSGDKDDSE